MTCIFPSAVFNIQYTVLNQIISSLDSSVIKAKTKKGVNTMRKRQTNLYLTESDRQWIAQKAEEQKTSRSCLIHKLISSAMNEDESINRTQSSENK